MGGKNGLAAGQIGDGPGDFEDAVPGTGRQVKLGGCLLQQFATGRVGLAAGIDLLAAQPGIGFLLALVLPGLSSLDTAPYGCR